MVKALFDLAKYLTWWWFIKPLVLRCCVANLTHMLQTSSSNKTYVLVASNRFPFPASYPNPLLNTLVREILSFTRSLMINTHPLVGCLENSDRKVKQFRVTPRIASSRLVYCSSKHWPNWMCLVLQRDSRFVSRNCHTTHIALTERLGSNGF